MSKIIISGASGHLGRELTRELLRKVSPVDIRLVTRTPEKLRPVVPAEVEIVVGDYNKPELLDEAYKGGDVLMLISGTAITKRVQEHRNAIEAAKKAGIRHVVYTSYVGIHPQNPNLAARDHIRTEADLIRCGLEYTILRDATYANWVYELSILPALRTGRWVSIKGDGRLAPVAKEDVVASIVEILASPEFHANATYEISGPDLFSFREIAELSRDVFNSSFVIDEVTPDERLAIWDSIGIPRTREEGIAAHAEAEWLASDELISGEMAIAQTGYQGILSDHVRMITGRAPRSFRSVLEEIAASGEQRSIIEEVQQAGAAS